MSNKRWETPRQSIAFHYADNDYGYVFHACILLYEFLFASDIAVNDLKKHKILDYGCGTGRLARLLALSGANVVGYDPTPECITEGVVFESKKVPPTSRIPKLFTSEYSQIEKDFTIVLCVNVLGHLDAEEFKTAINNITESLIEGGVAYLWVHKNCNLPIKDIEEIRKQPTNVIVVKGTKSNGGISIYQKCPL